MNQTMMNATQELNRRRRQAVTQKSTQTRPPSVPAAQSAKVVVEKTAVIPLEEVPAQVLGEITRDREVPAPVLDYLGITRLDSLKTDHMQAKVAVAYEGGLTAVREWRERIKTLPRDVRRGRMFVVCSQGKGCGKTHIAEAALDSFNEVVFDDFAQEYALTGTGDPQPNFSMMRHGRFFKANELMDALAAVDGEKTLIHGVVRPSDRIIVVDDVGREGKRKYEKRDEESQGETIRQLYYNFFDFCYQRTAMGKPVNIFLTSNLMWSELSGFFNDATMSRITEMAPSGNVWEMKGVPDYRQLMSGRKDQ